MFKHGERKGHIKAGGRQKGTPNKTTATIREAIDLAFDGLGGVPALIEWASKNPTEFYKLWIKGLPNRTELTGRDGGPMQVQTQLSDGDRDVAIEHIVARVVETSDRQDISWQSTETGLLLAGPSENHGDGRDAPRPLASSAAPLDLG